MMKRFKQRHVFPLIALLLALCLLAGCGGPAKPTEGVNAAPTETTDQQTSAPATEPEQTTPTHTEPEPEQEPEEEPEPEEPEEPAPTETEEELTKEELLGCWELFASEVEGDYFEADPSMSRTFLTLRGEGEDYEVRLNTVYSGWDAGEEYGWFPLEDNLEGCPGYMFYFDDEWNTTEFYELLSLEDGVLTVGYSFTYEDGTGGVSTEFYRRVEPDEEGHVWLPLSRDEIAELNESLTWADNGFFTHAYARPEEIDWSEVCYNGAAIGAELTDELREAYEQYTGWPVELDVEVVYNEDLARFAEEKTGVPYALARNPLRDSWTYLYDYDVCVFEHGDTNAVSVSFYGGYRDGDDYKLWYIGNDFPTYSFNVAMEMTCTVRDDKWTYYSNLPVSYAPATTLADVTFCETREEAEAMGVTDFIEVEELPEDEPNWTWAVVTSCHDGLRLSVDRNDYSYDSEGEMYSYPLRLPLIHLADASLDRGESVAVWVNLAWYPSLRVAAAWGDYFGELYFDEHNGLHLWDENGRLPDYILGHDDDAEGRGPNCGWEEELANFLDGHWVYFNEAGDAVKAVFSFYHYRTLGISIGERYYEIYLNYDSLNGDAPDLLEMQKYYEDDWWGDEFDYLGDSLGDYQISAVQLPNEQQLTLTQANNGDGVLPLILGEPGAGWQTPVVLHRYTGALPEG